MRGQGSFSGNAIFFDACRGRRLGGQLFFLNYDAMYRHKKDSEGVYAGKGNGGPIATAIATLSHTLISEDIALRILC